MPISPCVWNPVRCPFGWLLLAVKDFLYKTWGTLPSGFLQTSSLIVAVNNKLHIVLYFFYDLNSATSKLNHWKLSYLVDFYQK